MKRLLSIGVILLFIGMTISSSSTVIEQTSSRDVITVDDEGDGDYTTIKEALDNANPGDTIEVYSGTYYERGLDINKERITFQGMPYELGIGNDSGKPFIDGEGKDYVFLLDAMNITLNGFHIENKDGTDHDIIDTSKNADGCTISNNDLANTSICFIYVKGSNTKIINNNIRHSSFDDGICLRDPCSNCLVSGNNISNVQDGIKLWSSNHNTIIGNRVSKCSRFGIDVASDGNHIEGNSIEDNTDGIHMYGGINNRIINNNLISNTVNVHYLFSIPGLIITIISNRFDGNYYDDWRGFGPKLLWGLIWLLPIPCFDIDWQPASEPYDIGA